MKHNINLSGWTITRILFAIVFACIVTGPIVAQAAGPAVVNLLSADNFVILSKAGITNVPSSVIFGDIGTSPITGAAINVTCAEVTGAIYSVNAAGPLPCRIIDSTLLTAAVSDMEAAFTNAEGRTLPDGTELYAGNIGGQNFAPGLYKWSTDVNIATDVTLSGGANDVWIFQIAGDLDIASGGSVPTGIKVILAGGAQASNVFWQVGGVTGATLGTYSTFNGTILSATQVIIQSGAVLNGRAFAQTQVTLDGNVILFPGVLDPGPIPDGGSAVAGTISGGVGGGSAASGSISGTIADNSDGGGSSGSSGNRNNGSVLGATTDTSGSVLAANSFPGFPNTGGGGSSKLSAILLNSSVFLLAFGVIFYDRRRRIVSRVG